eukprot:3246447-Amphidinium_carterae.1
MEAIMCGQEQVTTITNLIEISRLYTVPEKIGIEFGSLRGSRSVRVDSMMHVLQLLKAAFHIEDRVSNLTMWGANWHLKTNQTYLQKVVGTGQKSSDQKIRKRLHLRPDWAKAEVEEEK